MLYEADLLSYPDPDWPIDPPDQREIANLDEEELAETQRVAEIAVDANWEED